MIPVKSGNARKRKPGGVTQHLTRSQRVNKLLRPPKLGIICLVRRRQCEQVFMRSRTDLSTDLRSISDRSHLRAILQESEAKLEMKNFNPPSFFVWR